MTYVAFLAGISGYLAWLAVGIVARGASRAGGAWRPNAAGRAVGGARTCATTTRRARSRWPGGAERVSDPFTTGRPRRS